MLFVLRKTDVITFEDTTITPDVWFTMRTNRFRELPLISATYLRLRERVANGYLFNPPFRADNYRSAGLHIYFFVWRNEIDRNTFLTQSTLDALWSAVLPLGLSIFLIIKKWGKGEAVNGILNNIKLFAGSVLLVTFFSYMLLTTVIWLLPGTLSNYTAYSEFSGGGRHDCSGVEVNDPDLQDG